MVCFWLDFDVFIVNKPERRILDMQYEHFTDERIDNIRSGGALMTAEERAFLIEDTPRLEECGHTGAALALMSDAALMDVAYSAWVDYARDMF